MLPSEIKKCIDELSVQYPQISRRALRAYFEQYWFAKKIIKPMFHIESEPDKNLLEIGPAEAGALKYFHEMGLNCFGIELTDTRYNNSQILNPDRKFKLYQADITKPESYQDLELPSMDFIILRDVIEHIPDKNKTINNIYNLLNPGGKVYVSFPPKWAPYAGHQQTAENRLAKIPYLYLFPKFIYDKMLHGLKLPDGRIQYLLNTKKNRISDREFFQITKKLGFVIQQSTHYFIRPEYEFRFGLSPRKNRVYPIPFLKHLFTNGIILILEKPN